MRFPKKTGIYDMAHRGIVTFCIGFTGIGTLWLAYKGAYWVMVKRPLISEQYREQMEKDIALKQTAREIELLQQQEQAETLKS